MRVLDYLSRVPLFLGLWSRFPLGPLDTRIEYGVVPRPHYGYGVFWAATTAKRLGIPRISVMEFGVAGGRGLLALESLAAEVAAFTGVQIDVYGFDTGEGLPSPLDYRDLPHIWSQGFYKMDVGKLRARLTRAQLVLGDVAQTATQWLNREERAPIGFIAFDLDYYSSTKAAFSIFGAGHPRYLPRVYCYFDDVSSNDLGCMNEHVGELLAIREFNAANPGRKIAKVEQLRANRRRWESWQEKIFVFHDFAHPLYCRPVITHEQLDL
jgi:hypothetical protein